MLKAKDYRHTAWAKLKGNWGMMALAYFVYTAIAGACGALAYFGVGAIALLIIDGPLVLGYTLISLNVVRGSSARIETLFDGFKDFARALVLYLLISIFTVLWTLLFIIPGIIKSLSYSMSYYVLLDHPELSSNEARKKSMELMKGNKWRLFCLELSFIGWILLSLLTFGILLFWVQPYMQTAMGEFYQSLIAGETPAPSVEENPAPVEEIPAKTEEVFEEYSSEKQAPAEEPSTEETPADDNGEV